MALLAVVLALCSEADAFVAASLTMVPLVPRLVFLVVGPAFDVKLSAMQAGMFGRAFAVRFGPATFVVATVDRDASSDSRSWAVAVSRGTQNLVLLLVGLSTAVMLVKGTYLNYVKPGLLPWLVAAAAVLVVLGVVVHRPRPPARPRRAA